MTLRKTTTLCLRPWELLLYDFFSRILGDERRESVCVCVRALLWHSNLQEVSMEPTLPNTIHNHKIREKIFIPIHWKQLLVFKILCFAFSLSPLRSQVKLGCIFFPAARPPVPIVQTSHQCELPTYTCNERKPTSPSRNSRPPMVVATASCINMSRSRGSPARTANCPCHDLSH